MSNKPVILISAAHDIDPVSHREQYALNKTYALAVVASGGIPTLPVSETSYEEYAQLADGLILTGGWPIHPDNISSGAYTPADQDRFFKEKRDPYDLNLYWAFRKAGKPVVGICRGHQMINIGQGGNLNYKISETFKSEHSEGISHEVRVEDGSLLAELYGEKFIVNSHHGYCTDKLGDDLKITAWSSEGIPEALEHETLPIYGFQWHPERMRGETPNPPKGPDMTKMFKYFVDLCLNIRSEKA